MTTRIITDSNGRKHITNEPLLHPLQRTWVGFTDEDRYEFAAAQYGWEDLLIAAEAKLKERNI
jgi:hypothetical protein